MTHPPRPDPLSHAPPDRFVRRRANITHVEGRYSQYFRNEALSAGETAGKEWQSETRLEFLERIAILINVVLQFL